MRAARLVGLSDLIALLDTIEAEVADAPDPLQWQMKSCSAMDGIHHPSRAVRASPMGH